MKHDQITYYNIWKLQLVKEIIIQFVVYWIICFKEHYKLIAIGFSEQQKLNTYPKVVQQNNFTRNLENNSKNSSLLKKQKNIFRFFKKNI